MAITIKDVAQKAQVGIGTVSRVLNNSPAVKDSTRQKVKDAIADLNYTPNPHARHLSMGKTWHIGVMLPHLTLPSYIERLRGVQYALQDTEYELILYSVGNPSQRDKYFDKLSKSKDIDGLLIISLPPNKEQAEKFVKSKTPIVLVDASQENLCHIIVDDIAGGELATQHLIDLGHRKIAFLSDHLDTPFQRSAEDRYTGYRQALEKAEIRLQEKYLITGKIGRQDARQMAKKLLALESPPTAIFAASDTQAIGVLDAAKELNIQIPSELSVIGYDGIRDSEYVNLTTVSQPLLDSGVRGIELLLKAIASKHAKCVKHIQPIKLVKRGTTSPPQH